MNKLYKVEPIVKGILKNNPETRSDDFLLIYEVYKRYVEDIGNIPFSYIMQGHDNYGLPYFETIRRTRQKLQAQYEELRPPQKVQDARLDKTTEYINYAIDGYNPTFMKFVDSQE